jgi:hypothetical protein
MHYKISGGSNVCCYNLHSLSLLLCMCRRGKEAVSWRASLSWCQVPSGAQNQVFIIVRQLRVGVLSDERTGLSQLLLVICGSESHGTHDHILLSHIRHSPNLEGQVPVFISPRNRVAQLYPQALGSLFVAFYDAGLGRQHIPPKRR